MTIRSELEILGPERVRRAMVAFEHRGPLLELNCPTEPRETTTCCFVGHAFAGDFTTRHFIQGGEFLRSHGAAPQLECADAFEGLDREALRQECIAFLADHGSAREKRPVSRETVCGVSSTRGENP